MAGTASEEQALLLTTKRPSRARRVEQVLRRAGVPFQTGLVSGARPSVAFLVPRSRLSETRKLLEREAGLKGGGTRFPWGPVRMVAGLMLIHLALVFGLVGRQPVAAGLARAGGLVAGRTGEEPWRLLTSLLVHADPAHVFWNGLSMLVFAVPLIVSLGYLPTTGIYLVGGVCGGLAALMVTDPGVVVFGSSGAVSALFGAWIALTLSGAKRSALPRRARIRVIGLASLFLPALLSPTNSAGQTISVESHLGGLAAGLAAGVVLVITGRAPADGDGDAEGGIAEID